ncbi:MAG: hypothetical protein RML84_09610, partial [Anaerolineae bacterium]|nr:hypothetical protein [Anaerolineae bacterium]
MTRLRRLHLPLLSLTPDRQRALEYVLGWIAFFAYLAWFYRVLPWQWGTHLHAYGDVVEALWQTEFWRRAVLSGDFNLVS